MDPLTFYTENKARFTYFEDGVGFRHATAAMYHNPALDIVIFKNTT